MGKTKDNIKSKVNKNYKNTIVNILLNQVLCQICVTRKMMVILVQEGSRGGVGTFFILNKSGVTSVSCSEQQRFDTCLLLRTTLVLYIFYHHFV